MKKPNAWRPPPNALAWAMAQAPAHSREDMAVKLRQIVEGRDIGEAEGDQRTVETLLEALES